MLPFYAERFATTKINYTFHRIPAQKTIENWKAQTPEKFRFALKAPQKITHWSKLRDCSDTLEYFCKVIRRPRRPTWTGSISVSANLQKRCRRFKFIPARISRFARAFEFRHQSWFDDEIFDLFKSRNIALCIADTETSRHRRKITADYGYLRLRREDYTDDGRETLVRFRARTKRKLERRLRLFQTRRKRHRAETRAGK